MHENRIEANYPGCSFLGWASLLTCKPSDAVEVHYLDASELENAQRARCCSPCCTHQQCFPDCCGICGQSLVVYSTGFCGGCCCRKWQLYPGLADADAAAAAINAARAALAARQTAPCAPGPQVMVKGGPAPSAPYETPTGEIQMNQY